jgi:hypothetical protein
MLRVSGADERRRGTADVRLAVPVRDTCRPRLASVVLADLVVLAVGSPHVTRRRPVATSVLEAEIALTALHTDRSIRGRG